MSGAIAGVNGVYVVADPRGNVFYVDGMQGGKVPAQFEGPTKPKTPLSIACGVGGGIKKHAS